MLVESVVKLQLSSYPNESERIGVLIGKVREITARLLILSYTEKQITPKKGFVLYFIPTPALEEVMCGSFAV